jgi:hypothetical protein
MPKVLLGSGRLVTLFAEYGPEATLKAAEMTDAPAAMSLVDRQRYNIATVAVAVKCVQEEETPEETDDKGNVTVEATYGKAQTQQDIHNGESTSHGQLLAFRKFFSDAEWDQLAEAVSEVYASPKLAKPYKIQR